MVVIAVLAPHNDPPIVIAVVVIRSALIVVHIAAIVTTAVARFRPPSFAPALRPLIALICPRVPAVLILPLSVIGAIVIAILIGLVLVITLMVVLRAGGDRQRARQRECHQHRPKKSCFHFQPPVRDSGKHPHLDSSRTHGAGLKEGIVETGWIAEARWVVEAGRPRPAALQQLATELLL